MPRIFAAKNFKGGAWWCEICFSHHSCASVRCLAGREQVASEEQDAEAGSTHVVVGGYRVSEQMHRYLLPCTVPIQRCLSLVPIQRCLSLTFDKLASHAISIRRPLPSTCSRTQRRTTSVLRMRWALPLRGVTGISDLGSQDAEGAEKEMETEEAGDVEGGVCS